MKRKGGREDRDIHSSTFLGKCLFVAHLQSNVSKRGKKQRFRSTKKRLMEIRRPEVWVDVRERDLVDVEKTKGSPLVLW